MDLCALYESAVNLGLYVGRGSELSKKLNLKRSMRNGCYFSVCAAKVSRNIR